MSVVKLLLILLIGAIAGFSEGASGAGWGVFTLAMLLVIGTPPMVAVSSSILVELILGVLNNVLHFHAGAFDWRVAVPLLATGVVGVTLGARVSSKLPDSTLKLCLGGIIIFFGWIIIVKECM